MGATPSGASDLRPIPMSIADPISAGYHEMPLPMIVVACKADSTVISADTVADLLDPFHVGLVEATATTEKGKNKMRMALAWVIQVSISINANALVLTTASGHRSATGELELLY